MPALIRQELFLVIAAMAAVIGFPLEHRVLEAGQAVSMAAAVALIVAILLASVRGAHHAEELAEQVGEPYGNGPDA